VESYGKNIFIIDKIEVGKQIIMCIVLF